ncbi:MAG: Archaeal/vacuolar-type H+-ATPase subunit E [Lachnospiraceae bacterium]|nr:Archaeal/vacuolar-type H+-ATPase subunit E [Lachnospiraceae bacterium]
MAGLDKILSQITAEAQENAAVLRRDAEGQAAQILENAKAEAEKITINAGEEAEKEAGKTIQRYQSMADTQRKQAFLASKQSMISECIAKAKDMILGQDDAPYFGMIAKLLGDRLQAKDGILYLSEKDKKRIPAGFIEKLAGEAAKKGGTLALSDKAADIDGGFVLAYGGIDENCSVSALFEENAEELSDTVGKMLFS